MEIAAIFEDGSAVKNIDRSFFFFFFATGYTFSSLFFDDYLSDFLPATKLENMKCDIYEMDNKCFIEMDMPGFNKNEIDIDIDNNYLIITASKQSEANDKNYIRRERIYSKISRSFYIGNVNENDIDAELKDGVLKIIIPKEETVETRRKIEVK